MGWKQLMTMVLSVVMVWINVGSRLKPFRFRERPWTALVFEEIDNVIVFVHQHQQLDINSER